MARLHSTPLFAVCCLLLLCAAPLCASVAPDASRKPILIQVAEVQQRHIPSLLEVAGTVQAKDSAIIAAKLTGIVTEVPVVLGSKVKKGELLLSLSAGEVSARLSQAQAQLAQARRNLDREQSLLKKNASTAETVKSMRDQYNMALAGYNEAKSMLDYTSIAAPFDGVITRKHVNSGDLATPGTPLLQLENNQHLQVRTNVPESLVLSLQTGQRLQVKVEATNALVEGVISEIAPAADPLSRTSPVVIDLKTQPDLRTGQFARVLLPGAGTQGLFIPIGAVVPKGQMDRVFVVEDGRTQLRLVRLGMQHEGLVEILSGLDAGERVAISNNRLLENYQRVMIQP